MVLLCSKGLLSHFLSFFSRGHNGGVTNASFLWRFQTGGSRICRSFRRSSYRTFFCFREGVTKGRITHLFLLFSKVWISTFFALCEGAANAFLVFHCFLGGVTMEGWLASFLEAFFQRDGCRFFCLVRRGCYVFLFFPFEGAAIAFSFSVFLEGLLWRGV